jgi:hypothetical protein
MSVALFQGWRLGLSVEKKKKNREKENLLFETGVF